MARKLVGNVIVNIFGYAVPLLVGIAFTPYIIHQLGAEKFGFLSVAWVIIGYFSIFDLGLGRALTQGLAARLSDGRHRQVLSLSVKTLGALLLLGCAAGLAVFASRGGLLAHVFSVSGGFRDEASGSIVILALGIPGVLVYNGLKGICDAFEIFTVSSIVRAMLGIWNFVSPAAVIYCAGALPDIIICLVVARVISVFILIIFIGFQLKNKNLIHWNNQATFLSIATTGGWMTVSNIISPLMTYMDRFFVSAISGLSNIQYYTTPYDVVTRLSFIPESIFNVIFPKMAKSINSNEGPSLYTNSMAGMIFVMFPLSLAISCLGPTLIGIWLGPDFKIRSTTILILLAVGLFINSLARVPYNQLQATGRARSTAIIHICEFPFYVAALVLLLKSYGVTGAAVAWLLRMVMDFIIMHIVAANNITRSNVIGDLKFPIFFSLGILGNLLINDIKYNIVYSVVIFALFLLSFRLKFPWFIQLFSGLFKK